MRITDQYFWNIVFALFFIALVVMGAIIVESEARVSLADLTLLDITLMTLASWRLIRLFVYDHASKWLREQFLVVKKTRTGVVLEKPEAGPRRTMADLFSCPWCMGVWTSAFIAFIYLVFTWAYYPVLFLAIAAVASFLQLVANVVGHKAEQLKLQNERDF